MSTVKGIMKDAYLEGMEDVAVRMLKRGARMMISFWSLSRLCQGG